MSGGGADILANAIEDVLVDDADFEVQLPNLDSPEYQLPTGSGGGFYEPVKRLANTDLTTKVVGGTGTFDYLMDGFKAHLKDEFEGGRITGEQYTKAYIALTEGAMSNATQFLISRDAAYWSAVGAQLQARQAEVLLVTARVGLETEKTRLQTLRYEALTARASYALTKLKLATESVAYDSAKYTLEQLMPLQKTQAAKQLEQIDSEIAIGVARKAQTIAETAGILANNELAPLRKSALEKQIAQQLAETLNVGKQGILLDNEAALQPQKMDMLAKQILGLIAQNALTAKQAENIQQDINLGPQKLALLIKQVANQEAQTAYVGKQTVAIDKDIELQPYKKTLLQEQSEAQRAQTMDTRTDGTAITGAMGKQRELYSQQITSYQRDSEMKATKVFTDAWVTMKTIDEGLAPPTMFSNTNLDIILTKLKANNGL